MKSEHLVPCSNAQMLQTIPGQALGPGCFLPDMLVVATEGLVDVEQENEVLGLLQIGLLAYMLEQLRGQQLRLVVM